MDNEDTCGFTLRHWLCYMIDKEKIPGLKWITPADQYGKSHARDKFVRFSAYVFNSNSFMLVC